MLFSKLINYTKIKNSFAFTLAEVLITLGIIGVVAVLTIPFLITSTEEKEFTESLKKFYSDISGAVSKINLDGSYDIVNATDATGSLTIRDALCDFLSCIEKNTVMNIFGTSLNMSDSTNTKYKNYKSSYKIYTDLSSIHGAAKLKNGMFFATHVYSPGRKSFQLYVDTNGSKGPNMFGKDLNMFEVVRDDSSKNYKVVVEGSSGAHIKISSGNSCLTGESSYANVWPCSYYRLYAPEQLP